jgi:hypothetical protein
MVCPQAIGSAGVAYTAAAQGQQEFHAADAFVSTCSSGHVDPLFSPLF